MNGLPLLQEVTRCAERWLLESRGVSDGLLIQVGYPVNLQWRGLETQEAELQVETQRGCSGRGIAVLPGLVLSKTRRHNGTIPSTGKFSSLFYQTLLVFQFVVLASINMENILIIMSHRCNMVSTLEQES